MPQKSGKVTASREARIHIDFTAGKRVEVAIDTGFDGELLLPGETSEKFNLTVVGYEEFEMVGSHLIAADVALAEIDWLGQKRLVEVIIIEGEDALAGTGMLENTVLTIDYIASTVTISNNS